MITENLVKGIAENQTPNNEYYRNLEANYRLGQHLLGDPSNRKIRILNVGSGLASINLAYYISHQCQNFELTLVEKEPLLGGVWNLNRYPGIACDVPSHIYQYSWAPNPDWTHFMSPGAEIRAYLEKVCDVFDLRKYIRFNTELLRATWNDKGYWEVVLRETRPGQKCAEYTQHAELLVNNSGTQHKSKWPEIEGLENFKGRLLHTAQWDQDFSQEQWKGRSVAVIGAGASAVQVVPSMQRAQPYVDRLQVYCRTPVWFSPALGGETNYAYDEKTKANFRTNPEAMVKHAKEIENRLNTLFPAMAQQGSNMQKGAIRKLHERMSKMITNPDLLHGFTPTFAPGCRRITPGDQFIRAVHQPNTEVIFKSVAALTEDGVVDQDGMERKVDTVVCATGFLVDFIPPFEVVGKEGLRMADAFAEKRDAYLGIGVPGFPNYFFGTGPYWTTANGSLISALNAASRYVVQAVTKLQTEISIRSITPSRAATDDFIEHAQQWLRGAVWAGNCPSWYKIQTGKHAGRVDAVWPGITLHFVKALDQPRWEDYEIEHVGRADGSMGNRFSYLGNGFVPEMFDESMDDSPHIGLHNVDPVWARAVGLRIDGKRS
ncbi:predicted protein [Neofusicoccum parvum]|nr:predicted protein [Neofusicoccum parvum]